MLVPEVSGQDELVPWLHGVIGRRLALARCLVSVQAEVESGVIAVPAARPAASARWHEQSSGVLWTGEGDEDDIWHGTWPMGDSRLTRFIADNDPETVIAGCEFELALLDEHIPYVTTEPFNGRRCVRCASDKAYPSGVAVMEAYPCCTVRLLGYGYRFRPGYREAEWKP
jgi:hypothetical protein